MTIPITLFKVQVDNLIPQIPDDDTEVSDANIYQQIKQAVLDYSRLRPDSITVDLAGDGGKYYAINSTNFAGYSDEFSRIKSIEYPAQAISSDETPQYLDPEDWDEDYYDDGSIRYLFLPNHAPSASETMRITYNGVYDWTTGTDTLSIYQGSHGFALNAYIYQATTILWKTAGANPNLLATYKVTTVTDANNFVATVLVCDIPEIDFFAVCNRAACLICTEIAARYSRTSDSTITADSVNHPTRAQMFASRAEEFCSKWEQAMGIGGEDGAESLILPGSAFVDWDTYPNWPSGREFLFHDSRTR